MVSRFNKLAVESGLPKADATKIAETLSSELNLKLEEEHLP